MKEVTQNEFNDYIKKYPRELKIHFVGMISPPVMEYHDFSLGGVPESCVAITNYWDVIEEDGVIYYGWNLPEEQRFFRIREGAEE